MTPAYSFTIEKRGTSGVLIVLTQTATLRKKEFFKAGDVPIEPLASHMQTLTDDQCAAWFKPRVGVTE